MKTLFYKLFGVGRIPESVKAQLQQEGLLAWDEGIRCSLRNPILRTPTKSRSNYFRRFTGGVALTKVRFMAFEHSRRCIDVPFTDERMRKLRFALEDDDTLLVEFDPALFHKDWSGVMVHRFHTPQAQLIMQLLRERLG
ncbi:MAG: hypothetical protein NTY53_04600 [Kiritimatiellaeota bacterium]|nr:hypothetical protein [Kiritimatiellota bacterium]